jgi:hypothetical protein
MIDIQLKKFDEAASARRKSELEAARSLVLAYFETLKSSCLAEARD